MKHVSSLITLVCLLFAVVLTAQVPGELAIINPGFETGDLSGWNIGPGEVPKVDIVTDAVSSGENAAKISGGSGNFYKVVSSEVELVPETFYCIVANVLIPSADVLQEGQRLFLASKVKTPSAEEWFESPKVVTATDGADVWYQLSFGLTYPADATELTVEFKWTGTGADDPGCVYVDDVKVIRMEIPEDIINLGFEDPDDDLYDWQGGWWTWSYLPVEPPEGLETWFETTISRSGDRSLAIVPQEWSLWSDDWWWGGFYCWTGQTAYNTVDYYHEGDNFYMSAWIMTSEGDPIEGDVDVNLELTFKDINGTNLSNMGYEGSRVWSENQLDESSTRDEWHFLEMFIQCPEIAPGDTVDRIDLNIRLRQSGDAWGTVYVDDVFIAKGTSAATDVKSVNSHVPIEYSLSQNYPNPFNPQTTIMYSIPKAGKVQLTVFDVLGKEITTLVNEHQSAGHHHIKFDGASLSSGIYFYRLRTGNNVFTKKLTLIR